MVDVGCHRGIIGSRLPAHRQYSSILHIGNSGLVSHPECQHTPWHGEMYSYSSMFKELRI